MESGLKKCTCCAVEKPVVDFYGDSRASDGLQSRCKVCFLAEGKKSAAKHRQKHLPRRREKLRQWRAEKPEQAARMVRAYKDAHPDKYAEIQRAYRTSVKGRAVALLNGARRRAKDRGEECGLSREWVEDRIAAGKCELTGIAFDMSSTTVNRRRPFSPSIDRINSDGGYTTENCRVVISALNVAINEYGDELFAHIATAFLSKREDRDVQKIETGDCLRASG